MPAINLAALDPDAPRPCLRCGTALLAGDLQIGVSTRSVDSEQVGPQLAPRIWSCPRCGYVELVNETHQAAAHEQAAHDIEQTIPSSDLAVVSEADGVMGGMAADPASTLPAEPALPEELAAAEPDPDSQLADAPVELEGQPIASADPAEPELVDDLVDAPVELEPAPSAALIEPDSRLANAPVELEDQPIASADPAEPELVDDLADAPVALDDQLAASAVSAGSDSLEELAALEAGAAATADEHEQAELADIIMPEMPSQASSADGELPSGAPELPAMPDGSAPGAASGSTLAAHSPKSPNGTVLKPRSGRGSRRQAPGGEPGAKPSSKRRSSGSKRKQTT